MHICYSYNCDYLPRKKFRFYLIDFQIEISLPNFCVFFSVKPPSVTQRSVSQENAFKKIENPMPFLLKTIGSNNYSTILGFKIKEVEFNVTVHYGLLTEYIQLWILNNINKYVNLHIFNNLYDTWTYPWRRFITLPISAKRFRFVYLPPHAISHRLFRRLSTDC